MKWKSVKDDRIDSVYYLLFTLILFKKIEKYTSTGIVEVTHYK